MPMPCYMEATGAKQGKIEGSCSIKGHEGQVLVQALKWPVEIPRSPQSGQPTGKRVHMPLTLSKEIDKATPKFLQALTSGEQFSSVKIHFPRISAAGQEEEYYTIELKNAILVNKTLEMPTCYLAENAAYGHLEHLSFTYEKVTETYTPDGIEAEDSWLEPKV